jgi:ATP-dependent DNA ligase
MGCDADKAIMRQEETGKLSWVMFDILFHCGQDVRQWPEKNRRKLLEQVLYDMSRFHKCTKYWEMSDRFVGSLKERYDDLIFAGYEGGMMKDTTKPYGKGWYKVKKVVDLDVVCTGFTAGKGKYAGYIGAITFGVVASGPDHVGYYMEISQAGGMDDETRNHMTLHQKQLIGEPFSILAQEITKTKDGYSVRHPRFKQWRPDIGAVDCTLSKFLAQGGYNEAK